MRKKIMIAAAILVMCFAFVSCGKSMADSPYVGTWKAVNASYSGIEMSVESIIGGEMTFELKDNWQVCPERCGRGGVRQMV